MKTTGLGNVEGSCQVDYPGSGDLGLAGTGPNMATAGSRGSYLTLILRKYYKKIAWVMFVWAALVAYSRIYMGVHYPGDVLVGAAVGAVIGLVLGTIANKIIKNV